MFVLAFQCPGTPIVHLCIYFALPVDGVEHTSKAWQLLWRRFLGRDDEFRNSRWKVSNHVKPPPRSVCSSMNPHMQVIPRIAEGSWMVKKAIGTKPAILGLKLQHDWRMTDRYLDVTCDVGSSKMASALTGMLVKYAKYGIAAAAARGRAWVLTIVASTGTL